MEVQEQQKPLIDIVGRTVEFGKPGEGEGLSWGVEVEIDLRDVLAKRAFSDKLIKIPNNINKIVYLELAPQEALPKRLRTIRSKVPPSQSPLITIATPTPEKPKLEKFKRIFNLMMSQDEKRFERLADMVAQAANKGGLVKIFEAQLAKSHGDTLVIVHGHSNDLSVMGEQYPDKVVDASGRIIQRENNLVSIPDVLTRYNNPNKYAAIVLNGCNENGANVESSKVPVFYPKAETKHAAGGFAWSRPGGYSISNEQVK